MDFFEYFNRLLPNLVDIDGFVYENAILMINDGLYIGISSDTISHPDVLFLFLDHHSMPVLDHGVLFFPLLDLVNQLGMPLRNLYLLLQALLFICQPSQMVFNHLRLNLLLLHVEPLLKLAGTAKPRGLIHRALHRLTKILG